MAASLARLRGGVVVSCQAPPGNRLRGPARMAAFARAAVSGGAVGIRADGPADITAIRRAVDVPVIGLSKADVPGSPVRITPTLELALEIAAAGADVIAVDATARPRPEPLERLIPAIRERTGLPLLADVSSLDEAMAAVALGADAVATTMSGYTQGEPQGVGPDLALVAQLADALGVPVIAEGRIGVPDEARRAIELGAFAVVVGTAITRPDEITRRFVQAVAVGADTVAVRRTVGASSERGSSELAIAIDIGGTKVAAALIDRAGRVVSSATAATPSVPGPGLLASVIDVARSMVATAAGHVVACGVATAGEVDWVTGDVVSSTSTLRSWAGTPLGDSLRSALGLSVVVENDGNAAAVAEARVGAGRGFESVLAVVVGTGIGGGIVIHGRIHRGAHGVAGGVGHLMAHPNGRRCPCGVRGCVEAYASGPAITRSFLTATSGAAGRAAGREVGLPEIAALARSTGDPLEPSARVSIVAAARDLGVALGGVVNALDPAVVVLGGGVVVGLGEPFITAVRAAIRGQSLPPARVAPVVPSSLGHFAGVVGAGLLAFEAVGRDQRDTLDMAGGIGRGAAMGHAGDTERGPATARVGRPPQQGV